VETVEGGGIVVLLLSNLRSLTQLYALTMDVHARFRTEAHKVGRSVGPSVAGWRAFM
jgi:N-acetyltransferase 10